MDSKRKANGSASSDVDDRSSKRRKIAEFDLSKGETPESTAAYGMNFVDQLRRTTDKSGRLIATCFEKLPPRKGNEAYYKQTRLPISLETIEKNLDNGYFKNLAELESYFKRMISNAKEFYPRSSSAFDDAERVRKTLSNYMTKNNPAYGIRGYQAQPTPLPEADGQDNGSENGQDDQQDNAEASEKKAKGPSEEGKQGAHDEQAEPAEQEQEEKNKEQDQEEEDGAGRSSRRRSIVLKRRESGRPSRSSTSRAQESPLPSSTPGRPDQLYLNVPYQGLNFQQAQEKIVEELLRYNEPEYEAYFEPFHNLPPRSLKDYYRVVSDPVSLRKLQKMVRGTHGRHGSSDFKSWTSFEEKAKLLWKNAYYYNEEGSEIYQLAQELEEAFQEQLKAAHAAVPDPVPPKIKLKIGQSAADTPSTTKKITIHVGGRGGSAESPIPQMAQTAATTGLAAPPVNGATRTPAQRDSVRGAALPAPSPGYSTPSGPKAEDAPRPSPAVPPQAQAVPAAAVAQTTPMAMARPQPPTQPPQSRPVEAKQLPAVPQVEEKRLRGAGKGIQDALITRLQIRSHPGLRADQTALLTLLPQPREMQNSVAVSLLPQHNRAFIVLLLPDFLRDRQYSLWVMINRQPLKPCLQPLPNQLPHERAFEVVLVPGMNIIEAHLIAAIPRRERQPSGPEVELEVLAVYAHLART